MYKARRSDRMEHVSGLPHSTAGTVASDNTKPVFPREFVDVRLQGIGRYHGRARNWRVADMHRGTVTVRCRV